MSNQYGREGGGGGVDACAGGVKHRFGCPRCPQGSSRLIICWFWDQQRYGPRTTPAGAGKRLEPTGQ